MSVIIPGIISCVLYTILYTIMFCCQQTFAALGCTQCKEDKPETQPTTNPNPGRSNPSTNPSPNTRRNYCSYPKVIAPSTSLSVVLALVALYICHTTETATQITRDQSDILVACGNEAFGMYNQDSSSSSNSGSSSGSSSSGSRRRRRRRSSSSSRSSSSETNDRDNSYQPWTCADAQGTSNQRRLLDRHNYPNASALLVIEIAYATEKKKKEHIRSKKKKEKELKTLLFHSRLRRLGECAYENDGYCDVPSLCDSGTDLNDCNSGSGSGSSNYGSCIGDKCCGQSQYEMCNAPENTYMYGRSPSSYLIDYAKLFIWIASALAIVASIPVMVGVHGKLNKRNEQSVQRCGLNACSASWCCGFVGTLIVFVIYYISLGSLSAYCLYLDQEYLGTVSSDCNKNCLAAAEIQNLQSACYVADTIATLQNLLFAITSLTMFTSCTLCKGYRDLVPVETNTTNTPVSMVQVVPSSSQPDQTNNTTVNGQGQKNQDSQEDSVKYFGAAPIVGVLVVAPAIVDANRGSTDVATNDSTGSFCIDEDERCCVTLVATLWNIMCCPLITCIMCCSCKNASGLACDSNCRNSFPDECFKDPVKK